MSARDILNLLKDLLDLDPVACHALVEARVPVDRKIEAHPTLVPYDDGSGGLRIGLLGVLNALAGQQGCRVVAEQAADESRTLDFHLVNNHPAPVVERPGLPAAPGPVS